MRRFLPISVIVPTYNRAVFLPKTLNAIITQQDLELELIVVDDFSSDDSREVLTSFKREHPEVVLIFLDKNLGESNAVNVGWSFATKQFVSVVNSDDPPHENWLKEMSKEIELNPNFGFYYPNRMVIDENDIIKRREKLKDWSAKNVFEKLIPIASAGLIIDKEKLPADFTPRDSAVNFPSDLIQMFNLALLVEGHRVETAWGVWREHTNSISGNDHIQILVTSFYNHVRTWLEKNEPLLNALTNQNIRTFYLYGNVWKIYRMRKGFFSSILMFVRFFSQSRIKTSFFFTFPFFFIRHHFYKCFKVSS